MSVLLPDNRDKDGKWERKKDPYGFFDDIPVCSVCGHTNKWREEYPYCPMCGAKMKPSEEEAIEAWNRRNGE